MAFAVVSQSVQIRLVGVHYGRNILQAGNLPETKIPDYLCTIT
jgi:hypothetical protein